MNTPFFFSFSPWKGVVVPLLLWFVLFTPWSAAWDLDLSRAFFDGGRFTHNAFWHFFYLYGYWPAWILFFLGLTGFILSFFKGKWRKWRTPCLYLILVFAIGSGLIVNTFLKEKWNRPRPRQVEEFGGSHPFRPYYAPGWSSSSEGLKSFPSGHASTGYYFFSLAFLGVIYKRRALYWMGLSLAWGLGLLLSLARIAEGGHFLSDTLASALIMWLVSWLFAALLFREKQAGD